MACRVAQENWGCSPPQPEGAPPPDLPKRGSGRPAAAVHRCRGVLSAEHSSPHGSLRAGWKTLSRCPPNQQQANSNILHPAQKPTSRRTAHRADQNARAWCAMPGGSMGSTRCRRRCRRSAPSSPGTRGGGLHAGAERPGILAQRLRDLQHLFRGAQAAAAASRSPDMEPHQAQVAGEVCAVRAVLRRRRVARPRRGRWPRRRPRCAASARPPIPHCWSRTKRRPALPAPGRRSLRWPLRSGRRAASPRPRRRRKPLPASPARAASIVAFSASRLVRSAASPISLTRNRCAPRMRSGASSPRRSRSRHRLAGDRGSVRP